MLSFEIFLVIFYSCFICLVTLRFAIFPLCLLSPICLFVPFDLLLQSYPTLRSLLFLFDLVCKQLSGDLPVLCPRSGRLASYGYPRRNVLELDSAGSFVLARIHFSWASVTKPIILP